MVERCDCFPHSFTALHRIFARILLTPKIRTLIFRVRLNRKLKDLTVRFRRSRLLNRFRDPELTGKFKNFAMQRIRRKSLTAITALR